MKTTSHFLLVFFFLCWTSIFCQNLNDLGCELYTYSISHKGFSNDKPLMVRFDYELPLSLKEDLLSSAFLEKEEKVIVREILNHNPLKICKAIVNILVEKESLNKETDYKSYYKLNYSVPIQIDTSKAYLIVEVLSIRNNELGPAGAVFIERYEKEGDIYGKWL